MLCRRLQLVSSQVVGDDQPEWKAAEEVNELQNVDTFPSVTLIPSLVSYRKQTYLDKGICFFCLASIYMFVARDALDHK